MTEIQHRQAFLCHHWDLTVKHINRLLCLELSLLINSVIITLAWAWGLCRVFTSFVEQKPHLNPEECDEETIVNNNIASHWLPHFCHPFIFLIISQEMGPPSPGLPLASNWNTNRSLADILWHQVHQTDGCSQPGDSRPLWHSIKFNLQEWK